MSNLPIEEWQRRAAAATVLAEMVAEGKVWVLFSLIGDVEIHPYRVAGVVLQPSDGQMQIIVHPNMPPMPSEDRR